MTTPSIDSFKARTGLASIPETSTDPDTGWKIYAAMGDIDGHQNQLVVTATSPGGSWPSAPVLDVAFNSTTTFEFMREGQEELMPDVAGLGPDLVLGQELNDLGGGVYSTLPGDGGGSSLVRLYYDTVAHAIAAGGDFTFYQPSMALGEWFPSGPFPAGQPYSRGDWLLYQAPDVAAMGQPGISPVLIGRYFLLCAQVRIHGLAQTYPGLPEYGRVAATTFEVGDPSLVSFLSIGSDYSDGRRNLSATATTKGFARW